MSFLYQPLLKELFTLFRLANLIQKSIIRKPDTFYVVSLLQVTRFVVLEVLFLCELFSHLIELLSVFRMIFFFSFTLSSNLFGSDAYSGS